MNHVKTSCQESFEERPFKERGLLVFSECEKILFSEVARPSTYCRTGNMIIQRGYEVPTGDLIAKLIPYCYFMSSPCLNEKQKDFADYIKRILKENVFYVYNKNIWTPEGVYVVQDESAQGCSIDFDIEKLENIVKTGGVSTENGVAFSLDGKVRFAPKRKYKLGSHTPESWLNDSYVIASLGIEGAKKFEKIASMFNFKLKTHGLDIQEGQKPIQRVTSLNSQGGLIGTTINDENDKNSKGYAFGAKYIQ